MTLREYIDDIGRPKVRKLYDVSLYRIYHWYYRKALPRPEIMQQIVRKTKGLVTYDEMINDFLKAKKSRKSNM